MSRDPSVNRIFRQVVWRALKRYALPMRDIYLASIWTRTCKNPRVAFSRPPWQLGEIEVGFGSNAATIIDVEYADTLTNISIGKYVSIGRNLKIIDAVGHDASRPTTANLYDVFGYSTTMAMVHKGPVEIGSDCWIGDDVTILGGTTIPIGCIVGTRTVVTSSLEPFGVYVGVPARQVRLRFDSDTRKRLLKSRWWDLPPEVIRRSLQLFQCDVEFVIRAAGAVESEAELDFDVGNRPPL